MQATLRSSTIMKALSLGFHDVVEDGHITEVVSKPVALYTVERSRFRDHLRAIQRRGWGPVCTIDQPQGWRQRLPILLTFDDGLLGSYTCVADDVERFGWRAHFFVVTDCIGRPGFLSCREIRELRARGHVIGSHTHTHPPRLTRLSWDQLISEWTVSCAVLSDILGERVTAASVAYGYYSAKVGRAAAAAGLDFLFSSEPTTAAYVLGNCCVMGRYTVRASTSSEACGAIAAGSIWPRWRQAAAWEVKKAAKTIAGDSYETIRRCLIRGVFASFGPIIHEVMRPD